MANADSRLAIIKKDYEDLRPSFDQLNLNGLNFFKELEFAAQILSANSYLNGAVMESKRNAITNIALTGLSLNPVLKYAYLIPRSMKVTVPGKRDKESQLMCLVEPSYMGLCKILTDTGSVVAISATIIYEREIPSIKTLKAGVNGKVEFMPYVGFEDLGRPVIVFTVAILPSGVEHVEIMRFAEWEKIKVRSESYKNYVAKKAKKEWVADPTWITDEPEMIRKTCLKRHYKYLPKTERAEQIAHIIDLDNQANGIDFEAEQTNPSGQAAATQPEGSTKKPEEPQEGGATEEDMNAILDLLGSADLPANVFENKEGVPLDNAAVGKTLVKKFSAGQLVKSVAEVYIKTLTDKIAEAKAKNAEAGKEGANA